MTTPSDAVEILYVGPGAEQSSPPTRVRQIDEIWATKGRAVAGVAALKLHRARTVA